MTVIERTSSNPERVRRRVKEDVLRLFGGGEKLKIITSSDVCLSIGLLAYDFFSEERVEKMIRKRQSSDRKRRAMEKHIVTVKKLFYVANIVLYSNNDE